VKLKKPVVHERHEKARTDSEMLFNFRHTPMGKLQVKGEQFVCFLSFVTFVFFVDEKRF